MKISEYIITLRLSIREFRLLNAPDRIWMCGRTRKSTFIKTFPLEKIKYSLVMLNQTSFYIKSKIRTGWILLGSIMKGAVAITAAI